MMLFLRSERYGKVMAQDITDYVKVYVKAGDGGNGCVSFHREKYVSHGGPTEETAETAATSF